MFDGDLAYLVLKIEGDATNYDKINVTGDGAGKDANTLDVDTAEKVRKSLNIAATDLIYNISDVSGCKERKKGFKFIDPDLGKEVYVNASNTIIYGNVEVLGVDIQALYISADKRLIGKGDIDSSKIKNDSIQSALAFANIEGLKGELGCDANGTENYNLYYLNLKNEVAKAEVETAKVNWTALDKKIKEAQGNASDNDIAARDKALKKYFSMAKAFLRNAEEKNETKNITDGKDYVTEAEKAIDENKLNQEDSFLESLGIRFKKASLIHYEAQNVNTDLNALITALNENIGANSQLLLPDGH